MEIKTSSAKIMNDGDYWLCLKIDNVAKARNISDTITSNTADYVATIKQYREKRSLNANAYFHMLVGKIASKMNLGNEETKVNMVLEYGTVATDEEGAKVGFKLPVSVDVSLVYPYAKWFDTRIENGKEFNCYIIYKQTHTLDSKEMARLIDGVVYEAKALGIDTATPEELARMKEEWNQ